jgi:hypothetical protein
MNQITKNGERALTSLVESQGNGVADAEAHSKVFCSNDFHKYKSMNRVEKKGIATKAGAGLRLCHAKLSTRLPLSSVSLHGSSLPFGLLHDLLEKVDIRAERLFAMRCQREGREGTAPLKTLRYRDVARLLQRSNMSSEIAVGEIQRITQLRKRELRRGGEQRHNGQPPLLVDDSVELK